MVAVLHEKIMIKDDYSEEENERLICGTYKDCNEPLYKESRKEKCVWLEYGALPVWDC